MKNFTSHVGKSSNSNGSWRARHVLARMLVVWSLLFVSRIGAQTLQDYFTNRIVVTNLTGEIRQSNTSASVEPNEPRHGGKTGGHSLWISWLALSNGIVSFATEASGFDTLLSAYQFTNASGTTFADLREVARADDSEGFERESEIEFGVVAGERYEIAVDGYFGAVGRVDFQWELKPLPAPPPQILNTLPDRAVNFGNTVSLVFTVTNAGAGSYRWFFNGDEIDGVNATNLVIPNFAATNVGRYKMRVADNGKQYYSVPVELQINTENISNALAQGKIFDAPGTPLIGAGGGGGLIHIASGGPSGVVRGYNGSQIFNTTYATADTNEPPHCGISGGTSYWLLYQPPTNGTITLDTVGSAYDTVLEAYTFNGALTSYADLISVACNNDGFGTNGPARVQFQVLRTRQYVIAVEGLNGGRGTAWLNYSLNTNQLPTAPTLLAPPQTVTAAEGSPATLTASLAGTPPLRYSWKKESTLLPGATASELFFPCVATNDTANYVMTVTNDLGSLSATLPLRVVVPPRCDLVQTSGWLQLSFQTVSGQRYTVEEAVAVTGPWSRWPNFFIGDGQPLMLNVPGDGGAKFYRIRVE